MRRPRREPAEAGARDVAIGRFDAQRQADRGRRPASLFGGWIRTGNPAISSQNTAGRGNCAGWLSSSPVAWGTRVELVGDWAAFGDAISPWATEVQECNKFLRVWCVEDR